MEADGEGDTVLAGDLDLDLEAGVGTARSPGTSTEPPAPEDVGKPLPAQPLAGEGDGGRDVVEI